MGANNDMPREKALANGLKALSDKELMAAIFSTGIKGKDVFELSADILADNGGHLSIIAAMEPAEFIERYKGIGPAKAITLLAGIELGVRAAADAMTMTDTFVNNSENVYRYIHAKTHGLDHEQFWVIYLKQNNAILDSRMIGSGGWAATAVDIRIIMREALLLRSAAMILVHNHPSGNLTPSAQDRQLTADIVAAAKLMKMRVLDHLIASDKGYYSFGDEGTMPS